MPSIGNGDKNWAPSKNTRSMSGLTNSGRPGSGKNRFRLGARITLPVVDGYCYVFQNWVFIGVELIHLALPENSLMMMLCLNTQASPQLPSRTAYGHSVESAEKRKKIFSFSRYGRANRVNTQASQKLPSRTAGGHNHLDGSRHCL